VIHLPAHNNSVCQKEYRAGYPPHLKNKHIARLWRDQAGMKNPKRVEELESRSPRFSGRLGAIVGNS